MVYTESARERSAQSRPQERLVSAKLISLEEARSRVLQEALPLSVESRPTTEALGMVVAEDVIAPFSIPPFDNSAMDGFAVRARDTDRAKPNDGVELVLAETIAAGEVATNRLERGQAIKIMTGAPIPANADAVVQSELTLEASGRVQIFERVRPGSNIRRAGEDVEAGSRALPAGSVLGPAEIGLLAGLGLARVSVHRRPRVAIVSTGSELVELDQPLGPGQIHNSNSYTLFALCRQLGVEPDVLGIVPDDYDATRAILSEGLERDVLLTSGGVSVGEFDFVKEVHRELGVEQRLWGVAMKPGKPMMFGVRGRTLVFGLPGNPASAMVSFELFVRPALLRLMGHRATTRPLYKAVVGEDLKNTDGRVHVVRVRAWREGKTWRVSTTGSQSSARLRSMIGANGLIFVPGDPAGVVAGEEVDLLLLREELEEP
jgi:molybdopterin molybdotransferase